MRFVFVLLLLVFFASFGFAEILVVEPLEQRILDEEVIDLGVAAAGETVLLIASTESGVSGVDWDLFSLDEKTLPEGWEYYTATENPKRLSLYIQVPVDARENIYEFNVVAKNNRLLVSEFFIARLEIRKNLLTVVVSEEEGQEVFVNQPKTFRVVLTNPSIADHYVKLSSNLSSDWIGSVTVFVPAKEQASSIGPSLEERILVPKKEIVEISFAVVPRISGKKDLSINVFSQVNGFKVSSFQSSVYARPTLFGKVSSTSFGFPFFTPSLFGAYFFSGFAGSFFS